jgi:hypothetical protein
MLQHPLRLIPLLAVFSGCATTLQTVPPDWLHVPAATRIRSVDLSAEGKVAPSSQPAVLTVPKGSIDTVTNAIGPMLANAGKPLTEPFLALDSFDLSESRGEVVFSAKRDDDFDVGLVAIEGSPISWVPDDPADEVAVQWAPKGSKISYIVRTKYGDVVKTLHIPTSYSFGVEFPFSQVHALGWDPQAERYAVAYSSPNSSDAVDILKYSGESRTAAVKPAARLDVNIEPFTGDAIVLQPVDIHYGEKLPLVVWVADDRMAWNDARADLMRNARVALVITGKRPDDALWQRARETAWIDPTNAFVVGRSLGAIGDATVISAEPGIAEGSYRRDGRIVTVAPAVVESFAARYIAGQLKRTSPPNGSR